MPDPPPMLLTVTQAAARLGVSSDTILRWTREGKLKYLRTAGGHRRFHVADVEAALDAMGVGPVERAVLADPEIMAAVKEAKTGNRSHLRKREGINGE